MALGQGQPRPPELVRQAVHRGADILLSAQLHRSGQLPLVVFVKGQAGLRTGLQISDVDGPARTHQHPVIQRAAGPRRRLGQLPG